MLSKREQRRNFLKSIYQTTVYIHCRISVMSCDILDYVADEIRSNEARVTLQLDEPTDVSNCKYLLVYCRYIHAVQLKD